MYLKMRALNFLKVDTKNERKTCLKSAFEGTKFGLDKHRESLAAPTVDPTVVRVHLTMRYVRNPAPVKKKTSGKRHNTHVLPLLNECIGAILLPKFRWLTSR